MPAIRSMTFAEKALTIRERMSAKGRETVTVYGVSEYEDVEGGRAFRLDKQGPKAAVYDVYLPSGPEGHATCDCISGEFRGRCKHRDALTKLVQLGRL
jgi:hypothetical protein